MDANQRSYTPIADNTFEMEAEIRGKEILYKIRPDLRNISESCQSGMVEMSEQYREEVENYYSEK